MDEMKKIKREIPFFLSVVLWATLITEVLLLAGLLIVAMNSEQLLFLQTSFGLTHPNLPVLSMILIPIILVTLGVFSTIMMMYKKIFALYLFVILSTLISVILLVQPEIDWFNLFVLLVLNALIGIHYSWFRSKSANNTEEKEEEMG